MRHIDPETTLTGTAVFVAMELSKSTWVLAAQASPSGKTSSHRLDGGDIGGLLALLRRLAAREQGAAGEKVEVVLGYEAGYDGFWLHRRLTAEGITCWVMDPGSLQVDRRARRAKTDRLDAAMLLRALMAWCRGDRAACHMVQVPSVEREDARRTHRERQRLITERVQHVNRIKGLLATQGVHDYLPLRRDRRERLAELRTGNGRALPPCLRREIEREFLRLELVLEQIVAVEAERDTAVRRQPPMKPTQPRWRCSPSSAASAPNWRPCWCARRCTVPLLTARRWQPMPGSRPVRLPAGTGTGTRASLKRAIRSCARAWSSSPGSGCDTSPTLPLRGGSPGVSARSAAVFVRLPPWPWPGSCWLPCGATSPPGWYRKARA